MAKRTGHRRLSVSTLALLAVVSAPQVRSEEPRARWQTPPLPRLLDARDGRTKQPVPWPETLDRLAEAEFVFLGETHTDETTHRVELEVYRQLVKRRDGKVVLALEMFERDVQEVLDDYLAGKIDEPAFRAKARVWGNYVSGYRPLIEFAKEHGLPVVASNFPRPLLRKIAQGGEEAWKQLQRESPAWVPRQVLPHSKEYWRRVDNAIRGHLEMMRLPTDPEARRFSTQSLWDNTMAESCVLAAERHPGWLVLHINGGFHSAYHDGTVRQLKLRLPKAKITTVALVTALDPPAAELRGKASADYVVFVESRARDKNEGRWGVTVGKDQPYRFSLPHGASDTHRAPLLIWLGDDGLNSSDGMALLKGRFGEDWAIAVVEPTYRQTELDGSEGGRWFYPDTFSSDLGTATGAVERIWGYLCRRFPVAPSRVVVAGEGTGATVVAAIAAHTDRLSADFLAVLPRRASKLKDLPLPLKEFWGDDPMPQRRLVVVAEEPQRTWWQGELDAYGREGLGTRLRAVPEGRADVDRLLESELGRLSGGEVDSEDRSAGVLVVPVDTPRARFWGRLQALRHAERTGERLRVVAGSSEEQPRWEPRITPELLRRPGAVPRCPGPFGGTTVLVLSSDQGAENSEDVAAWLELEQHDPLAAASRFHRLRIVTGVGERSLAKVLEKLHGQRRRNVLIVPATFAASPEVMWRLRREAAEWDDRMTLQWLPGLGGQQIEGLLQKVESDSDSN